ncbi:MAG: histidine--tRNA ligase [Rhodothermaceae bacterium]|nr:histidine--tRNA ligase [Rhodothermaceae bacterium]
MSKVIRNIKGTFDILPVNVSSDAAHEDTIWTWQYIEKNIRDILELSGFKEIRTPLLEPTELIARGIGQLTDIVSKEMYAFEREGTHYVLRPEVTAPVMRAYLQHHLAQQGGIQKLYYFGPCFRAERPQKGRYRQFHQFGCELIGTDSVYADVEVIATMMHVYSAFNLPNMKLLINSLGDETSRPRYKEALRSYFSKYESDLTETSKTRLEKNPLRILDTKVEKERVLLESAPKLIDYIDSDSKDQYVQLKGLLTEMGIEYVEDPFLVRGLDYYTKTAFELVSDDLGAQSALGGGGRYDLLSMEVGSKSPVPAVGFASGIERLLIALREAGTEIPEESPMDVFVVGLGEEAQKWSMLMAQKMREAKVKASYDLRGKSMKVQMKEAHRLRSQFVVIVGEDELTSKKAIVKNMETGDQQEVHFNDLVDYFTPSVAAP